VLGQLVRNNLPVRVIFQCPDIYASMMLIGSQKAAEITTPGRGYFVSGNKAMEIQTPYISDSTIERYVQMAVAGKPIVSAPAKHDVSPNEILKWAQEDNNGALDWRSVFDKFKERGLTANAAKEMLAAMDGREEDVEGERYKIVPGGPRLPRRMVPLNETNTDDAYTDEVVIAPVSTQ
jgi:DNA segregation ATPase FtsK/SpoIIIE-like protein